MEGYRKSKMADEKCELPSNKRARLCCRTSTDEEDESSDDLNKIQQDQVELKRCPTEEKREHLKVDPTSDRSREQNGGQIDSLRHESPQPCTSGIANNINDSKTEEFPPIAGPMGWIQRQMMMGVGAREVLSHMFPRAQLPPDMSDAHLWKIVIDILSEPTPRQKLGHINTLEDVIGLLQKSKNIIVLTGAGVSVSCGIPDFRSHDGIYARLSEEYPDLPDPQSMFNIEYFFQNPRPFFKFAKEIYPGQFKPSLSHRFIRQLETNGQLLRNYSQNIDTLEQVAGITRVLQCHGSFSTASCTRCKYQVTGDMIKSDIFSQVIPRCPQCPQDDEILSIMKPDIVFFGESLPGEFYKHLDEDVDKADLVIVIGSSLKVRPVALIPNHVPSEIPQVLINREPLHHLTFDVELLGDCDAIVAELCKRLGTDWTGILQGFEVPQVDRNLLSCMETLPHSESADDETLIYTFKETESEHLELEKTSVGAGIQEIIVNDKEAPETCRNSQSTCVDPLFPTSEDGSSNRHHSCHDNKIDSQHFDKELPTFLFMAPSRYMFHGAELHPHSPLPCHGPTEYVNDSSSNSESSGTTPDDPAATNDHEADGSGYGSESSNPSDEKLAVITGRLSSYSCVSEENSRMSSDDLSELTARSTQAIDLDDIKPCFDPVVDDRGDNPRLKPEDSSSQTCDRLVVSTQAAGVDTVTDKSLVDDFSTGVQKQPPKQELLNSLPDNPG